jgi:hypothetical protein
MGCVGTLLLTSTFQASWGQGLGGFYSNPGTDEGLSSTDKTLIAVGATLGATAFWWAVLGRRKKRHHDEDQQGTPPPRAGESSPTGASGLPKLTSEVRLVPQKTDVAAGERCAFDLQVRGEDGKWYSVTRQEMASIELQDADAGLVRLDGAKNTFCVPVTASAGVDGKNVVVVGHYTPASGEPLTAETTVQVHVSGSRVAGP